MKRKGLLTSCYWERLTGLARKTWRQRDWSADTVEEEASLGRETGTITNAEKNNVSRLSEATMDSCQKEKINLVFIVRLLPRYLRSKGR
jgi:hypothetical protein